MKINVRPVLPPTLILGDLKPGDQFEFTGHPGCAYTKLGGGPYVAGIPYIGSKSHTLDFALPRATVRLYGVAQQPAVTTVHNLEVGELFIRETAWVDNPETAWIWMVTDKLESSERVCVAVDTRGSCMYTAGRTSSFDKAAVIKVELVP